MEQLPKIVIQRLRETAKPEVHPDPDVLTGFAEQSLGERERELVLEHLANCGDCREIVSLSLAQFEMEFAAVAAAAAPPVPLRFSWTITPILRWAVLAACVVVVGGVLTLRHRSVARQQTLAAARATDEYAEKMQTFEQADQLEQKPVAPPPASSKQSNVRKDATAGAAARVRSKSAETHNKIAAGQFALGMPASRGSAFGGVMSPSSTVAKAQPQEKEEEQKKQLQAEHVQVPSVNETVEVQAASPLVQTDQAAVSTSKSVSGAQSTRAAIANGSPIPLQSQSGANFAVPRSVLAKNAANAVGPRWTLSPDGTVVLRSLDAGKTWQPVPVADGVVFRVVATMASEIWVGGSSGALYYSSDAGQEWEKVEPSSDGRILVADIVAIAFTDAQHCKLTTANHEVWTTADAGQSWKVK